MAATLAHVQRQREYLWLHARTHFVTVSAIVAVVVFVAVSMSVTAYLCAVSVCLCTCLASIHLRVARVAEAVAGTAGLPHSLLLLLLLHLDLLVLVPKVYPFFAVPSFGFYLFIFLRFYLPAFLPFVAAAAAANTN